MAYIAKSGLWSGDGSKLCNEAVVLLATIIMQ